MPALAASIAIPGLFRPVAIDGRVLVDGGATNPLPFDQLLGLADVIVAVDVFGVPAAERSDMPSAWESMFTTLLSWAAPSSRRSSSTRAPDLVIRPNVAIFRTLDFYQASAILRAAEAAKAEVKESSARCSTPLLEKLLEQLPRFGFRKPAIDLRPMMAGRRSEKLHAIVHRAALGIGGAVIKPADAGEGDRAGAHRAGLERDIEVAIVEPLGAERKPRPARMAMISACAVGSRSASVRLPARAKTSPPRTTTQPTGTSPRSPAARASSSAISINDAMVASGPVCYQPGILPDGTMDDNSTRQTNPASASPR